MGINGQRQGLIPSQFYRYLETTYKFRIYNFCEIDELIASENYIYVENTKSKYHGGKGGLIIPLSLHIQINCDGKVVRVLVESSVDKNFHNSFALFRTALQTTPRVHKYLAMYKVYESLTSKHDRDITFSSIRHSLAHSASSLTRPTVIKRLNELFGGLEIDPDSFRHKKVLYTEYFKMLIEVDKKLAKRTDELILLSSSFLGTFKRVTTAKIS